METQNAPLTKEQEFEKAAMPLMEYLALNHHPHIKVLVTSESAELLEGQLMTHLRDKIADLVSDPIDYLKVKGLPV